MLSRCAPLPALEPVQVMRNWKGREPETERHVGEFHAGVHSAVIIGQRLASFKRLCAVQSKLHSPETLLTPRIRNCRNPRACLIWPNTGSTTCCRNR